MSSLHQTAPAVPVAAIAGYAERAALLADLAALDERLAAAVARLREATPGSADPTMRGLLIEDGDADVWMTHLAARDDRAGAQGTAAVPPFLGQSGGRLARLGDLFGLTPFERGALLTVLAPEIDLAYANLYAYVQDDVTRKYGTVGLALTLWCSSLVERMEARGLLGPDAPLRRRLLLSVEDAAGPAAASFLSRPLSLDPRIAAYLLGSDQPDPALGDVIIVTQPAVASLTADPAPLPDDLLDRLRRQATGALDAAPGGRTGLVVWMRGPERQAKRTTAELLAASLGRPLISVDCTALAGAGGDIQKAAYRALREARLQRAVLYWAGADALALKKEDTLPELGAGLVGLLADQPGCSLFDLTTVTAPHLRPGLTVVALEFPAPSNERRRRLWEDALAGVPFAADVDLDLLSGAFRLTGDQIAGAAESARQEAAWHGGPVAGGEATMAMRDLVGAARAHSSQNLGMLARKIIPRYNWNDLVLPPDRLAQLQEICSGVRFAPIVFEQWGFDRKLAQGKGVNILFAGQPGTGKTMAAEVLAADLGLDLYKIDLSAIVSKYIGETEKNLEKIFREGRTSNAILFFDEADSIFGKRSEVKDSHDRYANMEISYLLQRMEEYDGIVVLATNLRKNMDEAFVRRLRGAIEFPMPEEPDRLEIWRRTFPVEAPLGADADLVFLARQFKLSGGNIKNIVLEAAFLAARAGTAITMAHLVHATRREHQKIGRLIAPTDFGPYADLARRIERAA